MITIEAISESTLPAIAEIEAELFEKPLSLPALKSLFDGPAFTGFISFENAIRAGYVLAHLTQDQVEILSLGTARQYQRRGHASLLLTALISTVRDTTVFWRWQLTTKPHVISTEEMVLWRSGVAPDTTGEARGVVMRW